MKLVSKIVAVLLLVTVAGLALPHKTQAAASCINGAYRKGAKGTCVTYIQTMLNGANSAGLKVDGDFGPKTRAAVVAWQDAAKKTNSSMLVDGIVGPQTWGTLCAQKAKYLSTAAKAGCDTLPKSDCVKQSFSTRRNPSGACVGYIQSMLNLANNAGLAVDDRFDTKTNDAVKAWQKKSKISQDGIVGPQTWKKLCGYKATNQAFQEVYKETAQQAGCKV